MDVPSNATGAATIRIVAPVEELVGLGSEIYTKSDRNIRPKYVAVKLSINAFVIFSILVLVLVEYVFLVQDIRVIDLDFSLAEDADRKLKIQD